MAYCIHKNQTYMHGYHLIADCNTCMGPFKCYVTQWGCQLSRKKRYEGERFNVISITKGGVNFPGKK